MAKPKRIGHLVINVKDQDASTRFYTEVLGFEIAVERPGFGTFLTCGRIHHDLALFQAKEGAQEVTEGGLGLNHMAIQVEDYEELKDYYHKLQEYYEVDKLRTVDHSNDQEHLHPGPGRQRHRVVLQHLRHRRGRTGRDAPSRPPEQRIGLRLDRVCYS